ncbi:hypothetical protein ACVWZV_002230 [Bradyrhizobium sp. GM5.1]
MDYASAGELRDAGFPQVGAHFYWSNHTIPETLWDINCADKVPFDAETIAAPTLEELIEACGEKFGSLGRNIDGWFAFDYEVRSSHFGKTPSESVASLWLALNKK